MKLKLTLTALALTCSPALSQTVIDITGSTAGRGAVYGQIQSLVTVTSFAFDHASALGSANTAIFHGTFNGQPVIIRTFFSGSVNGVRDVARAVQQTALLDKSVTGTAAGQPGTTGPLAAASAESAPEIGFSDVFQTSTEFTSPALTVEDEVGVIPFKWFKNNGASAALSNVTPSIVRGLYGSLGELPLSLFTGVAADSTRTVYCSGRNADSGTRITAMAESGYGVFRQVNQYTGTVASGALTLTFSGNSGFSSGGNVATLLRGTLASGDVIAYLGAGDWAAASASPGGATELGWNGVTLGTAAGWEDKIRQGQYTFWGYLHQNRMVLTGTALAFYDALKNGLLANPSSGVISPNTMDVYRDGDGAPVFHE